MNTQLAQNVTYERMQNGADVYLLRTNTKDLVLATVLLPGGRLSVYEKQSLALLLPDLFPYGTAGSTKQDVKEQFALLGAHVSLSVTDEYVMIRCTARKDTVLNVLELLCTVLQDASVPQAAFKKAQTRARNKLRNLEEDTHTRARTALVQRLYKKGHPLWTPSLEALQTEVVDVLKKDHTAMHRRMYTGTGAMVTLVGDVHVKRMQERLYRIVNTLPQERPQYEPNISLRKLHTTSPTHTVVSLKDKMNIDTVAGIPLLLPQDNEEQFLTLALSVHILGGSSTSRLFNTLRTRESLTYGAYASLEGYTNQYPGYLRVASIFPQTVFTKGRESLLRVLEHFTQKGVTQKELTEHVTQVCSAYVVNLTATQNISTLLTGTLVKNRPLSYIDEYPTLLKSISLRDMNAVIKTHLDFNTVKTAAAGSVDKNGKTI